MENGAVISDFSQLEKGRRRRHWCRWVELHVQGEGAAAYPSLGGHTELPRSGCLLAIGAHSLIWRITMGAAGVSRPDLTRAAPASDSA
jgi:hypothetical protein